MKKIAFILGLSGLALHGAAQEKTDRTTRRNEKRQKINAMIRQEEEGVLVYRKQTIFGAQLRTNGYGILFELGRMKTPRMTAIYTAELTETKHPKEDKSNNSNGSIGGSYIYGKINNFYALKLGYGRQYILGQKGNKNGVAVIAVGEGGLSLGLLRPYYLDIRDGNTKKAIKFQDGDTAAFLGGDEVIGSSGLGKGWNEMKLQPGAYVKAAIRFDFNKYNERVQAIQLGVSLEGYAQNIQQMALVKPRRLFFQGHLAYLFGGRK
ncbi:hypothetical protein [Flaviaesturariibacter amylovorans]|uniref:Uncharacterized protein n=1 Tax=Flaviaesturariibacter amylovorans TaxID=1084520 RepID=A0ABP8GU52_9BACT